MADVRLIGEETGAELSDLLAREAVQNLLLLGFLEEEGVGGLRDGHAFFGMPKVGPLQAVVLVTRTGLWAPNAGAAPIAERLGSSLRNLPLLSAVGDRASVDALWRGYNVGGRRPRLARVQRLMQMTADDMGPWVDPKVRLAKPAEVAVVAEASALMQLQDLGIDPRKVDGAGHERRVFDRIRGGRTFVLFEGDRLLFKVDVGARSRFGAQLEGVYTAMESRRQGWATKGLGQVSRTLLSSIPRLALHVDEANAAAIGLYRKLGFHPMGEFRLLVAE